MADARAGDELAPVRYAGAMRSIIEDKDIVLALALTLPDGVAAATDLESPRARQAALRRLEKAGLYDSGKVLKNALREFVVHGLSIVFPPQWGETLVLGIGTAVSGPILRQRFAIGPKAEVVWPNPHGRLRGTPLVPLHPALPRLAPRHPGLHHLVSLADAMRAGRARERAIAGEMLREALS